MSPLTLLLIALLGALPVFLAIYALGLRLRNFGIVDVAWAGGFTPIVILYACAGGGDGFHRWLLAVLVSAWSLRLALHLGLRVARHHPKEDGRYASLRREWAPRLHRRMGGFFLFQAILLVVLSMPFALVASASQASFTHWDLAALILVALAVGGEALADAQLDAFKRKPSNHGRVCEAGLWGWSRHPNYFFEWLVWVGFALAAVPVPYGWLAWLSPLLMLWFLTRVTGIRYTEEQLLNSKGDAYRAYQQRTSAFIPWPPQRPRTHLNPSQP